MAWNLACCRPRARPVWRNAISSAGRARKRQLLRHCRSMRGDKNEMRGMGRRAGGEKGFRRMRHTKIVPPFQRNRCGIFLGKFFLGWLRTLIFETRCTTHKPQHNPQYDVSSMSFERGAPPPSKLVFRGKENLFLLVFGFCRPSTRLLKPNIGSPALRREPLRGATAYHNVLLCPHRSRVLHLRYPW